MIVNALGPYLFVPSFLLTGWYIVRRKSVWALATSLPMLIYVIWFWPYVLPRTTPLQTQHPLRVLTFNILYTNQNYDQIASMIEAQQPDLIALQEVKLEAMRQLINRLESKYPYYILGNYNAYGSTAAFSRYPLDKGYVLDLGAERPATVMQLRINGQSVSFISAHLQAFGWSHLFFHLQHESWQRTLTAIAQFRAEQLRQAEILAQEANKQPSELVILGCDCNTRELMTTYSVLAAHFHQAAQTFGWQPAAFRPNDAFHDLNPQHLDYIFYSGNAAPQLVYKLKQQVGSDHYPLVTDFAFTSTRKGDTSGCC